MSKIRFYTDEHVAKAIIRGLRQRGVDVLTVPEANMMGASDEKHLAMASFIRFFLCIFKSIILAAMSFTCP